MPSCMLAFCEIDITLIGIAGNRFPLHKLMHSTYSLAVPVLMNCLGPLGIRILRILIILKIHKFFRILKCQRILKIKFVQLTIFTKYTLQA